MGIFFGRVCRWKGSDGIGTLAGAHLHASPGHVTLVTQTSRAVAMTLAVG